MKKKLLLTVLVMATLFTGCKNESENNNGVDNGTKADTEIAKTAKYGVELDDKEKIPAGDEIIYSSSTYGTMKYTVTGYKELNNIKDVNLTIDDIINPCNNFANVSDLEKYTDVSNYISDDGQMAQDCTFVLLNMKVENVDAVGLEKKNEFNISNVCLYTPEPISRYYEAYFSEGHDDGATAYNYTIEQGETKNIQIGFLVLNKDVDSLIGGVDIGNNEILKFQLK